MMRALLIFGLALAGCAPQASAPAESALAEAAPAEAHSIRSLLLAFHAEDLPNSDALHAHPDAEESLIYLSEHADRLLVRARALSSLRFFPTDRARHHLVGVIRAADTHPKLLAAALHGCEGRSDGEVIELAHGLTTHTDPRVRRAAFRIAGEGEVPGIDPALAPLL